MPVVCLRVKAARARSEMDSYMNATPVLPAPEANAAKEEREARDAREVTLSLRQNATPLLNASGVTAVPLPLPLPRYETPLLTAKLVTAVNATPLLTAKRITAVSMARHNLLLARTRLENDPIQFHY